MLINNPGSPTSEHATHPSARLSVIGIGASAGGLAALRAFFSALPENTGLTYVVVVHLSPEHDSALAEVLQPYTNMPVTQVTSRVEMQPDHVYVIPPAKQLIVSDSALDLAEFERGQNRPMQIDAFFRSLAADHGDGGAVILSGSGSDGAVGIQEIKGKGGLLLVQSPTEAEYDGMPRSAIATGLVDIVAPVAELAVQLAAAKQAGATLQLPADGETLPDVAQHTLTQILAQLRVRTGQDFSGYKQATLLRRIGRRMQLTHLTTLTAYLQRLRQDADETTALLRDLLINVTGFFRDPEAWAALETTVIPQLFAGKGRNDTVRIWSVGCATGEEAYSLAMLLMEYAGELVAPPTIQLFASDLSKVALDFAREGCYPEAIADDLTEQRLLHFFTKDNSHYKVRSEVREVILFTQHNLLQDPPFSKLDLIVCRNLLIYIQRELQEKIFETFYYALRGDVGKQGYLFLGNAESAEGGTDLFETLEKRQRIYCRRQGAAGPILPTLPLISHAVHRPTVGAEPAQAPRPAAREEHYQMLEAVAPPSVLVDRHNNVLHLSETVGRFLLPPGGAPTVDLLKLVRPELQAELRAALLRAFEESKAVATRPVPVKFNGAPHPVYMMVRPHQPDSGQSRALVTFLEDETPMNVSAGANDQSDSHRVASQQLEAELRQVQGRLQSMREEYETTVEELRAANEELQSTNEEYKSTLEELETSKEELQSINEELQTINQEFKNKIEEVSQAHGDLQNLLVATDIATLFLDRDLRIKRYTPRAADLFNLMPPDRGRPITHLRANLFYEQLATDAQQVLTHLAPVERELQSQDEQWFLVRVRPYRTLEDKIDGVVISFVDITTNKQNELALRNAKEYAESIVHTIPDALLVLDPNLHVQMVNDAFYEIFQVDPATTSGSLIYDLGNGQWDIPALRNLLEEILPDNKVFVDYEVDHTFETIGRRTMLLNGRRLDHVQLILLSITDITTRKQAEEQLRRAAEFDAFRVALDDALRPLTDPVEIQATASRVLGEQIGADRVYYVEIDEAAKAYIVARDWRRQGAPSHARRYPLDDWPMPWLLDGQTWVVRDVDTDPALPDEQRASYRGNDIGAAIVVPLIKEHRLVATFVTNQGTPRAWMLHEITLVEETADRIWVAIERTRAQEALRQSEERFRALVAKGADMITISDRDGHLTYASPTTQSVTGYTPEEFMQQHPFTSVHPDDRPLCEEALQQLVATPGLTLELQYRFLHKEGTWRWLEGSFTSLYHEPSIGGMVTNVRDITARKEAEAALQHLNSTLEQQVDTRTAQMRALASELAMAEQQERRRISQILHDDLQQLLYGMQMRMMSIMTDMAAGEYAQLADYAQEVYTWLGDAIQTTRRLTVDLSPPVLKNEGLVDALHWLATQMAAVNNLQVELRTADAVPIPSEDMRVLLFQIVRELLFNVVKHAQIDHATVDLRKTEWGECMITIQDEGRGFDVATAAAKQDGGFGLFSVSERLNLFGGRMDIQSAPGEGTQITIYAPFGVMDQAAVSDATAADGS